MLGAVAWLAGCAPLSQGPASSPTPPSGTTTTPVPAATPPAGRPAVPNPAVIDTVPSADAAAVLATIPDPLAPSERVPAPNRAALADSNDLAPAIAVGDSADPSIPVPSPTKPLGDRPGAASDSVTNNSPPAGTSSPPPPASSPPATPPPASSNPPTSSSAPGDTCWRVQIAAPADANKAESYRAAAQSLLLVPMVIETDKGLHKVRTKDCLDRLTSQSLQRRAVESGFAGAFRFVVVGRRP